MAFRASPILVIIAFVCVSMALLFQIVGIATNEWSVLENMTLGLWKGCDNNHCTSYGEVIPEWLAVVRAFGLIGLFLIFGCLTMAVIQCFSDKVMMQSIAMLLAFIAAIFLLVELAVCTWNMETTQFGYSFVLTVVSFALCIVSGVCFCFTGAL